MSRRKKPVYVYPPKQDIKKKEKDLTSYYKNEKTKVEKNIRSEICKFISEKKCKSVKCDNCAFCNGFYCNKHIFEHVEASHTPYTDTKSWINEFKKKEFKDRLMKLHEKYEDYLSD